MGPGRDNVSSGGQLATAERRGRDSLRSKAQNRAHKVLPFCRLYYEGGSPRIFSRLIARFTSCDRAMLVALAREMVPQNSPCPFQAMGPPK